jgi:ornithine decarboxylase
MHPFVNVARQPKFFSAKFLSPLTRKKQNRPEHHSPFKARKFHFGVKDIHPDYSINDALIREIAPAIPMSIINTHALARTTRRFVASFPGDVMFAVKCNPDPIFLREIYEQGVRRFDVASLHEITLLRDLLPFAGLYFMHPIKAPEAIAEAYSRYRVRAFVLDTHDELEKILQATNYADDLELFVRIAVPKGNVATDFSTKFGAKPDKAANLIANTARHAATTGVSFHVGTQCTNPQVYANAVGYAASIIADSDTIVNVLDIGGGFPTTLSKDTPPPPIETYMNVIRSALQSHRLDRLETLCEAGRGLVADAGSLVVRVEARKGDLLYVNDGTYGGLFEAGGAIGLPYPARLVRSNTSRSEGKEKPFRLAGPTCDSVDMMNGPFIIPDDVQAGDWIILDKLGAYGEVSRSNFNGFGAVHKAVIK